MDSLQMCFQQCEKNNDNGENSGKLEEYFIQCEEKFDCDKNENEEEDE